MPRVKKNERYVNVAYELMCGYERATALADDLNIVLKKDKGFYDAKDDTRGWDVYCAVVVVTYCTLADALRLDPIVRQQLSRKVNFTYDAEVGVSYGQRGATARIDHRTTLEEVI